MYSTVWLTWKDRHYVMVSHGLYKENIILGCRLNGDDDHDSSSEEACLVMFNVKTKEFKLLPCFKAHIWESVIVNEFLYATPKETPLHRIDLSKNIEWEEVKGINITEDETVHSGGDKLLIDFQSYYVLYNPDTQKKTVLKHGSHVYWGRYVPVKDNYYYFAVKFSDPSNWVCDVYNMKSQLWEDIPKITKDFSVTHMTLEIQTIHVYNDRWILLYVEYCHGTTWNFWIFDTHTKQWTETETLCTPEIDNFIWIRDKFIRCECYDPNESSPCPTEIYDISHFLSNWYIIEHLVLLRKLVNTGRAHCIKNTNSEVDVVAQKLMMDLDLDMFRTVLSYFFPSIEKKEETNKIEGTKRRRIE